MNHSTHPTTDLYHLHSYHSVRLRKDWNRCGQAAVATLLDFHGLDPFSLEKLVHDPKDGCLHWEYGEIVPRIVRKFPPDHLFGLFGTTARQIETALASFGLKPRIARSWNATEGRRILAEIKRSTRSGLPVIVLLDMGKLGGRPFGAHWVVVYRVEGSVFHLANCGRAPTVPEDRLLRAFRCRFMLGGLNHCAVFVRPPSGV